MDPGQQFEKACEWVKERVHDPKHFTARWLQLAEESSSVNRCVITQCLAALVAISLLVSKSPFFICNGILVAVPCILIFVYPDESPKKEHMTIYWVSFGVLTVLDGAMQKLPLYYHIKLLLLLLLFIEPYRLVDKIEKFIEESQKKTKNEDNSSMRTVRSPVKPKQEEPSPAPPAPPAEPPKEEAKESNGNDVPKAIPSTSEEQTTSGTEMKSPAQKTAIESFSTMDMTGHQRFKGVNPMQTDMSYRLPLQPGIDNKDIDPENNLLDLICFPVEKLVFNAPFDFDNITYHIKIMNNSHHHMAFAIKCNAIPRILCYPPHGILKSKEILTIAVTCKSFDVADPNIEHDRIAFDYLLLKDNDQHQEFSLDIFQLMSYRNGSGRDRIRGRNEKSSSGQNEGEDLLVFGYSSRLFASDARAAELAAERHLLPWDGDPDRPLLDRFDVRLLLSSVGDLGQRKGEAADGWTKDEECPTEQMEEEMCDEERYKDLDQAVERDKEEERIKQDEEAKRRKKAEFHFSYDEQPGTSDNKNGEEDSDSESEDEPFQPPPGIKFPVGLVLPETQKLNHIIERTALFVVEKGPQMEIVIKAKQRNNASQFGFLEFDNILYAYYKYVQKLIREKKYTPSLNSNSKSKIPAVPSSKGSKSVPDPEKKTSNALSAIAEMGSDDSDESGSDYELHPSLLASSSGKRAGSPDIAEGEVGPRRKPLTPETKKRETEQRNLPKIDYDMSKSNDVYAALFKNLSGVNQAKELEKRIEEQRKEGEVDDEWREWWLSFYGEPCSHLRPAPLYPPPPDLEPIVQKYAELVAQRGAATEIALRNRVDLKLDFMKPENPCFSYYQHKVRTAQWRMQTERMMQGHGGEEHAYHVMHFAAQNDRPIPVRYDSPTSTYQPSTPVSSASPSFSQSAEGFEHFSNSPGPNEDASQSPQGLNRKQRRRRLQEAVQAGGATAPPPGVFDPLTFKLAAKTEENMHKSQSSPAISLQADATTSHTAGGMLERSTAAAVSFSLAPMTVQQELLKGHSVKIDDFEEFGIDFGEEASNTIPKSQQAMQTELTPPVPPSILSNTQLDRKEKARIFMEKLLNEKRLKKQKEEEEAIQEAGEITQQNEKLTEEEEKEKIRREELRKAAAQGIAPTQALSEIDRMINSRIDNLLQSTMLGAHVKRPSEERAETEKRSSKKHERDKERDDSTKKRKKEKRSKRKRDRSRSRSRTRSRTRSRSRSRERRRKRHRRSSESSNEFERRRSRSRSRDRSWSRDRGRGRSRDRSHDRSRSRDRYRR